MEGYGQIRIDCVEDMVFELKNGMSASDSHRKYESAKAANLMKDILLQYWLDKRKLETLSANRIHVSNTALGRITLMLRESLDEHKGRAEDAFVDFANRIASIKTDATRKEAETLLNKEIAKKGKNGEWQWIFGDISRNDDTIDEMRDYFEDDDIEKTLRSAWGSYLMSILVEMKYRGGENA